MITSVFNKSKPINFIIVLAYVILIFTLANFNVLFSSIENLIPTLTKFFVTIFLIFLVDFIVSKNNLTQRNSYAILIFGLLLAIFPETMNNINLLIAKLFIVFALRRIISLGSKKNVKKKFFDAAFWISLATLFYFWSVLFFAIVIVALIYHWQNDIKNIIIPLIAIATVGVFLLAYNILFFDTYLRPSNFQRFASLDYTIYNSKGNIIKLTILFTSLIWTIIYFFRTLGDKNKKLRPSYYLITWATIIGLLVAVIAPTKNGSEFVFIFMPFSIIMANYIESISEHWFKEVFVGVFIITPIVVLLL